MLRGHERARALLTPGRAQGFPGHKDAVTGLAFREGTQQLFSASLDRTVKIWSLAERAYVDTLYGHQAGVLAVDVLRQARSRMPGFCRTAIFLAVDVVRQARSRMPGICRTAIFWPWTCCARCSPACQDVILCRVFAVWRVPAP